MRPPRPGTNARIARRATSLALVVAAIAAAALSTSVAAAAPTDAPVVITLDASIDASGTMDVTKPLREAIASVPDGGTLRLAHGARYRVEGTLRIKDRQGFLLEGRGATIFATTPRSVDESHLWVDRGSNVTIRNLTIVGANADAGVGDAAYHEDHETLHGVRANGTEGLELDRVTITDVFGDFVYIGRDDDKTWSSDIWIHDSTFDRNGRQGLAFTAVRRVVVERNIIRNTRRSTIDLEPNTKSWGVEDVQIIDNRIGLGRLRFVASHGGGQVTNVVIARNTLRDHVLSVDMKPPDQDRRRGVWVVDNMSDTEASPGPVKIVRVDGVVVRDNVQPVRKTGAGVDLRGVCGDLVEGNDVFPAKVEVTRKGPTCGTPPDPTPPDPPAIPARVAALANPTTTRPPTTTSTSDPTSPSTAVAPDGENDGGNATLPIALAAIGFAVLFGFTITAAVVRRRRIAARSDDQLGGGPLDDDPAVDDDPVVEGQSATSDENPAS